MVTHATAKLHVPIFGSEVAEKAAEVYPGFGASFELACHKKDKLIVGFFATALFQLHPASRMLRELQGLLEGTKRYCAVGQNSSGDGPGEVRAGVKVEASGARTIAEVGRGMTVNNEAAGKWLLALQKVIANPCPVRKRAASCSW